MEQRSRRAERSVVCPLGQRFDRGHMLWPQVISPCGRAMETSDRRRKCGPASTLHPRIRVDTNTAAEYGPVQARYGQVHRVQSSTFKGQGGSGPSQSGAGQRQVLQSRRVRRSHPRSGPVRSRLFSVGSAAFGPACRVAFSGAAAPSDRPDYRLQRCWHEQERHARATSFDAYRRHTVDNNEQLRII